MARDAGAQVVQGPDSGGNPVPVIASGAGTQQDVNVAQIGGTAVATQLAGQQLVSTDLRTIAGNAVSTAGSGRQTVGIVDTSNASIKSASVGEVNASLQTAESGSDPTNTASGANAAATKTYAAVASQKHHLTSLSLYYSGANTAQTLTVTDGGATVFSAPVPASQTTLLQIQLPGGGLRCATNSACVVNLPAGGAGIVGTINTFIRTY